METNGSDPYYNNLYYGSNLSAYDLQPGSYYHQSSNPSAHSRYNLPDLSIPPPTAPPSAPPIAPPIGLTVASIAPPINPTVASSFASSVPPLFSIPPPSVPLSTSSWPSVTQSLPQYDNYNGTIPPNNLNRTITPNNYCYEEVQYSSRVPPITYSGSPLTDYLLDHSVPEYFASKEKYTSEPLKENGYVHSRPNLNRYSHRSYDKRKRSHSPKRRDSHSIKSSYKDRANSPKRIYNEKCRRISRESSFRSSTNRSSKSKDSKTSESRNCKRSMGSRSRSPSISEYRKRKSPVRRSYRKSPIAKPFRRSPSISPARSTKQGSDSDQSKNESDSFKRDSNPSKRKSELSKRESDLAKRESELFKRESDLSKYESANSKPESDHSRLESDLFKHDSMEVKLRLPKREMPSINSIFAREEKSDSEEEKLKLEEVRAAWVRSAPADLYYQRDDKNPSIMKATQKLINLCSTFEETLLKRAKKAREANKENVTKEIVEVSKEEDNKNLNTSRDIKSCSSCANDTKEREKTSKRCRSSNSSKCSSIHSKVGEKRVPGSVKSKKSRRVRKVCISDCSSSDSGDGSSSDSSSSNSEDDEEWAMKGVEEMERKKNHPDRLHPELWFNDPGEMNDGPLCRCSLRARRSGIRHGYYAGEEPLEKCDQWANNADKIYHYLVTISPPTNFLVKTPTIITHDSHEFIFEGFSLLSHHPLEEIPTCQVIRFNIEYSIYYVEEKIPENFCIKELELFYEYLFKEVLELIDLNFKAIGDDNGCSRFHFMPRFVRQLPDNGKEVLSMNEVLSYLMKNSKPLVKKENLDKLIRYSEHDWLNYTDQVKGMIVTYPGKKPCSIRIDQLDRDQLSEDVINYPVIVHFGIRPPQLSYAGNPSYQKALREYVKFRHLLANMPKPSFSDKRQLEVKESRLQEMRMASKMKRDVTVAISAEGFYRTGIMCDIVQHALLIPVLVRHLRFHRSLITLEEKIKYKFKTGLLLQLALTHPSYRENFGTNPDHARNSLTNCGVRQPQYGDRRIHFMNTHKRGINTLVNIMSRFGKNEESDSKITHNERLEFLGDAVVEFLTSIHLFHLFPTLEEGGLATYRAAVVQNQHLAVLADKLSLHQYVLHAHGSDLCHTFELRHAMANCFEALMGAIFIDSNIEAADAVFSATLFQGEEELHDIWVNYKPHPLQEQEPQGDRRWIETFPILQRLATFEESIGIQFTHIRLLARSFTDRSIGFNYLTLGSNQRLEFLGDTVLQLVASEYLYRFFPEHHEGHLSLLRSSLVNNRTQAVVCDDLQMTKYAMYSNLKTELKTKDRADLLEAFLGALYIDRGLDYCRVFCLVCFFPRLQQFIINQEWNDPKSKLQQCCLTLRTMEGGEPDIPVYKVIECKGPTNTRVYTVAVYFKDKRLAKASGHSIQQAEMNAAKEALLTNKQLFPQLAYQRRVIEKNIKIQGVDPPSDLDSKKTNRGERNRGNRDRRNREERKRNTRPCSRRSEENGRKRSGDKSQSEGGRRRESRLREKSKDRMYEIKSKERRDRSKERVSVKRTSNKETGKEKDYKDSKERKERKHESKYHNLKGSKESGKEKNYRRTDWKETGKEGLKGKDEHRRKYCKETNKGKDSKEMDKERERKGYEKSILRDSKIGEKEKGYKDSKRTVRERWYTDGNEADCEKEYEGAAKAKEHNNEHKDSEETDIEKFCKRTIKEKDYQEKQEHFMQLTTEIDRKRAEELKLRENKERDRVEYKGKDHEETGEEKQTEKNSTYEKAFGETDEEKNSSEIGNEREKNCAETIKGSKKDNTDIGNVEAEDSAETFRTREKDCSETSMEIIDSADSAYKNHKGLDEDKEMSKEKERKIKYGNDNDEDKAYREKHSNETSEENKEKYSKETNKNNRCKEIFDENS